MLNGIINRGSTAVNTSGTNLTVDSDAIFASASGNNIAIGENALNSTDTAAVRNIAIGKDAGTVITNGDDNTLIGYQAGDLIAGHSDNVAVGSGSLQGVIESAVAIGYQALGDASLDANANGSVAVGYRALYALEGGQENTAIGYGAMLGHTTGSRNTALGYGAMDGTGGATVLGSIDNTFIGRNSGGGTWTTNTSDYNVAVGNNTLDAAMNGAQENVAVGHNAGSSIVSADYNVLLGSAAGVNLSAGSKNIAIGKDTLFQAHDNIGNIAIGYKALEDLGQTDGDAAHYNVAIGHEAMLNADDDLCTYNVGIGYNTLAGNVSSGGYNTVVGAMAGDDGSNVADNLVIIGAQAGRGALTATADGAVIIGKGAGAAMAGADKMTVIGYKAGAALTGQARNTVMGFDALSEVAGTDYSVVIGSEAGKYDKGNFSLYIGDRAGMYHGAAGYNIAIGGLAMGRTAGSNTDGTYSNSTDLSDDNIFIGHASDHSAATNPGSGGGQWVTSGTNSENVAIGNGTMVGALNGAVGNTCIGFESGNDITSGDNNTFVGHRAGDAVTTGSNNTFIGQYADTVNASRSYQTGIGTYGIIKYLSRRVYWTAVDSTPDTVCIEVFMIPDNAIITRVTATVVTKSTNLSTFKVQLSLSTSSGTAADGALANAGSTITNAEILGANAANTYQQNSTVAMAGTAADIDMGSGATANTTYTNIPTTTIVGTANTYLYICNAIDNGTTATSGVELDIMVEYMGKD